MKKRLIVCFDGTCNSFEIQDPQTYRATNVLEITRLLETKKNTIAQIVLYVPGVGTGSRWDRWVGAAKGLDVELNLLLAYQFLIDNYVEGDDVFLFGFSRGAFTARLLAGFLDAVKVIPKERMPEVSNVYDCYKDYGKECIEKYGGERFSGLSELYVDVEGRKRLSVIPILFLGVWDTVTTLVGERFSFTSKTDEEIINHPPISMLPSIVHNAYQALALHEIRHDFPPNLWTEKQNWQTIEQTWFAGAHADVGGGVENRGLADIALEWMVDRAKLHGLEFNQARLEQIGPRKTPPNTPRFFQPITDSFSRSPYVLRGKSIREPGIMEGLEQNAHLSVLARLSFSSNPVDYGSCSSVYSGIDSKSLGLTFQIKGGDLKSIKTEIEKYEAYDADNNYTNSSPGKYRLARHLRNYRQ
jgi:uncharacterized protein (DUF2235 family)